MRKAMEACKWFTAVVLFIGGCWRLANPTIDVQPMICFAAAILLLEGGLK